MKSPKVSLFTKFSVGTAKLTGKSITFITAVLLIVGWALSGPLFNFSDSWQLVVNTSTTIITFLMVFLIQATQNRDSMSIHLKLNEIIRVIDDADNQLLHIEDLPDEELYQLHEDYKILGAAEREAVQAKAEEEIETIEAHKEAEEVEE